MHPNNVSRDEDEHDYNDRPIQQPMSPNTLLRRTRQAAEYNMLLLQERQGRNPLYYEPHTRTVQVIGSWISQGEKSVIDECYRPYNEAVMRILSQSSQEGPLGSISRQYLNNRYYPYNVNSTNGCKHFREYPFPSIGNAPAQHPPLPTIPQTLDEILAYAELQKIRETKERELNLTRERERRKNLTIATTPISIGPTGRQRISCEWHHQRHQACPETCEKRFTHPRKSYGPVILPPITNINLQNFNTTPNTTPIQHSINNTYTNTISTTKPTQPEKSEKSEKKVSPSERNICTICLRAAKEVSILQNDPNKTNNKDNNNKDNNNNNNLNKNINTQSNNNNNNNNNNTNSTVIQGDALRCTLCRKLSHFACQQLDISVVERVKKHGNWKCIDCKICEVCSDAGHEDRLMICDGCDRGFHTFCLVPQVTRLPQGGWRCESCVECKHCGTKAEGTKWRAGYTSCDSCQKLYHRGKMCPICDKVYRFADNLPMVQCDDCQKWVHTKCDNISDERYQEMSDNPDTEYTCSVCKDPERKRQAENKKRLEIRDEEEGEVDVLSEDSRVKKKRKTQKSQKSSDAKNVVST